MRHHGRVSSWKDEKGFGFITPARGGQDVFVHRSAFLRLDRRPKPNDSVIYELAVDGRGRLQATAVSFEGEPFVPPAASRRSSFAPVFAACFLLVVLVATAFGRLHNMVLGAYVVASVLAFVFYALDKSAAQQNRRRTPESTLHFAALVGGWPGALAAQRILRHKSSKASFQVAFWVTVMLNCAALGWLLTPIGERVLRSILGDA